MNLIGHLVLSLKKTLTMKFAYIGEKSHELGNLMRQMK